MREPAEEVPSVRVTLDWRSSECLALRLKVDLLPPNAGLGGEAMLPVI